MIQIGPLRDDDAELLAPGPSTGWPLEVSFRSPGATVWDAWNWRHLAGAADQAVPVLIGARPELNGWYRVESVSVDDEGVMFGDGVTVGVVLARLGSTLRSTTLGYGNVVTNSYSVNGTSNPEMRGWLAVQTGSAIGDLGYDFAPTATGEIALSGTILPASFVGTPGQMSVLAAPGDAMNGATIVEAWIGGAWRITPGVDLCAGVTALRVSNGWVRVTLIGDAGVGAPWLMVESWDAFAFEWRVHAAQWRVSSGSAATWDAGVVQVKATSRASSTIRIHMVPTGIAARAFLDVSLRRGDTSASCVWKTTAPAEYGLASADTVAVAPIYGAAWGLEWDTGGPKPYTVTMPQTYTIVGGVRAVLSSASQVFRFGIGVQNGPAYPEASSKETAGRYMAQWWPSELTR